jgi:chloramphenicol 3-O-phosphotransferase
VLVLLIGPKGSGKTHVGRLLEARFGVHFFHVEPHWMAYHAECEAAGRPVDIAEGVARIRPLLAAALRAHEHVCVETTGASPEILDDLLALGAGSGTLVVKVRAPLELCLARIASRDPRHQIPLDEESIRRVHALAESERVPADLEIDNVDLADADLVRLFRGRLPVRSDPDI